jgi:hypothetical protein
MIVALLLLAELVLMAWLVWCLVRSRPPGKSRDLGFMSYVEERADKDLPKPKRAASQASGGKPGA